MDFISKLITQGEGGNLLAKEYAKFSEKDSWNPADIWLLSSTGDANAVLKDLKENGSSIQKVNAILKLAYKNRQVVGISLKKVGKTVKYEEVNLEMKG